MCSSKDNGSRKQKTKNIFYMKYLKIPVMIAFAGMFAAGCSKKF